MFDVGPTNQSGGIDFEQLEGLQLVVDLKNNHPDEDGELDHQLQVSEEIVKEIEVTPQTMAVSDEPAKLEVPKEPAKSVEPAKPQQLAKNDLLGELQKVMASPQIDIHKEISEVGGQLHNLPVKMELTKRLPPRAELVKEEVAGSPVYRYHGIAKQIDLRPDRTDAQGFWDKKNVKKQGFFNKLLQKRNSISGRWLALLLIPVMVLGIFYMVRQQSSVKRNVVQNGRNAVANLGDAERYLKEFRFEEAENSFALAYDDFSRANSTLGRLGASFSWFLKYIPGLRAISSANNLTLAGQNIAKVGQDLSAVFQEASEIKVGNILNPQADGLSFYDLFKDFKAAAISSQSRISKTRGLLADIDKSILPEDKRELFGFFEDKLPQLSGMLDRSVNLSSVLLDLVPNKGVKKYLILFQNNSELRATGGFPGSYSVVTFENGLIKGIKIDDIYNPDGQIKDKIIPPKPLQHITPTWGARDANWFPDFPTSAKKVIEFYKQGSGESVDGVITMTPDIVVDILKLTGPISMPEYGMSLSSENFLAEVQEEVEYGEHQPGQTPKKIIIDFFPKFLDRLTQQDADVWSDIAGIFSKAVTEKHILAYFNDAAVQEQMIAGGLSGAIDTKANDYLQVVFTNVKGSKTDHVTDSSLKLVTEVNEDGSVDHELIIIRNHNGGGHSLGFYNRPNPDYVRVYLPKGAEPQLIDGNDYPDYLPLVDYKTAGYKSDPSLEMLEIEGAYPLTGVDTWEESGRTVFGFWMNLEPKQSKAVLLRYKTKDSYKNGIYQLMVQKQSGTPSFPLEVTVQFPEDTKVDATSLSGMEVVDGSLMLKSDLSVDRLIKLKTQ